MLSRATQQLAKWSVNSRLTARLEPGMGYGKALVSSNIHSTATSVEGKFEDSMKVPEATRESGDFAQGDDGHPGASNRPAAIDVELDMDEGPELAMAEGLANPREYSKQPLGRPVDLEFELDKDDPECIDLEDLHKPRVRAAMEEVLGRPVDLEAQMDRFSQGECLGPGDIEELQNPRVRAAVMEALGRPVGLDHEYDLMGEGDQVLPAGGPVPADVAPGDKAGRDGSALSRGIAGMLLQPGLLTLTLSADKKSGLES